MIILTFDVKPIPTGRPRLGRFRTFTPKKTLDFKALLIQILEDKIQDPEIQKQISVLYHKPISLTATFYLAPPKRLIKKRSDPWRVTLPTTKPDTDNLIKGVKDVLTGYVYHDDSQVTHEFIRKIYDLRPRVELIIQEASLDIGTTFFTMGIEHHVYDRPT